MALILDKSRIGPASADAQPVATPLPDPTARRLRVGNLAAALFHFASAVVFLILATDFDLPVTAAFPTEDPALTEELFRPEVLFEVTIGYGVAAFSLLSALFHMAVATVLNRNYNRAISQTQNPFRWIEYSLSATLMMLLIIMLIGEYDIGALIGIAAANVSMILFGWLMERHNRPGDPTMDWYPFVFGCLAGIAPWIVGSIYFAGALSNADEAVPVWVWGIFISVFVMFNCFAVNQFLQYKRLGKWRDYVFGEGVYIALSFIAKTALVWQIYFGTAR